MEILGTIVCCEAHKVRNVSKFLRPPLVVDGVLCVQSAVWCHDVAK